MCKSRNNLKPFDVHFRSGSVRINDAMAGFDIIPRRFKDCLSPLMRTTPFKSTTIKIQLCPANVSSLLLQAQDEFPLVTFDQRASTVGGQAGEIGADMVKVAEVRLESKEYGSLKDATKMVIDVFGDYVVSVESDVGHNGE